MPRTRTGGNRYDKLGVWPAKRPAFINFIVDQPTRTVYITDVPGERLLAIPCERIIDLAANLEQEKGDA